VIKEGENRRHAILYFLHLSNSCDFPVLVNPKPPNTATERPFDLLSMPEHRATDTFCLLTPPTTSELAHLPVDQFLSIYHIYLGLSQCRTRNLPQKHLNHPKFQTQEHLKLDQDGYSCLVLQVVSSLHGLLSPGCAVADGTRPFQPEPGALLQDMPECGACGPD
jgi:hypothetical protein